MITFNAFSFGAIYSSQKLFCSEMNICYSAWVRKNVERLVDCDVPFTFKHKIKENFFQQIQKEEDDIYVFY